VEFKITRKERPALSFDLRSASVPVQVIDRRPQVGLSFPIREDEPTSLGLFPLAEHGSRPVCEWDDPAAILALAFPDPQKPESSSIHRRQGHVCPFQVQCLTDSQSGLQHQDSDIVQRLRASAKVDFLLLPGENKIPDPFPGE
jgi:hypothetical protein